jgi:nitroimidazol reductase NimA-like FMN-containing flavoprotein (pyridoxamine 5'-phosphate oxidase superfamily)/GNAT superfamily N-acetyltransferase
MESVTLEKAGINDCPHIHQMQVNAFAPLLEKYHDAESNPGAESIEKIIERMRQPFSQYYFIRAENMDVGIIRVNRLSETVSQISPIFILPEFQNKGYAQHALLLAESLYPQSLIWRLSTIEEEPTLCRLYEKLGYKRTDEKTVIRASDNTEQQPSMTIVGYEKNKIPETFAPVRRKDRALPPEEAYTILEHGMYGTLSVMSGDGYPYGIAMNYACDHEKIYLHCACAPDLPNSKFAGKIVGKKVADFTRNPKVCFSVFSNEKNIPDKFSTDYDSVVVFGTIKKCADKKDAIAKIISKYCPDFIKEGAEFSNKLAPVFETYEISIEHISAKARRLG